MKVSFIKESEQKYNLTCVRNDGTTTSADLEMRSYFKHDLMHFVVERMAHIDYGFFGKIIHGMQVEELSPKAIKVRNETMDPKEHALEMIVASLQKTHPTDTDVDEFIVRVSEYLAQLNVTPPHYFSVGFVRSVLKEFNDLLRKWHLLRHGGILTVNF
ncbi:MAG: hypothetical protein AAB343_02730 [Patescibacteria group bacterium]